MRLECADCVGIDNGLRIVGPRGQLGYRKTVSLNVKLSFPDESRNPVSGLAAGVSAYTRKTLNKLPPQEPQRRQRLPSPRQVGRADRRHAVARRRLAAGLQQAGIGADLLLPPGPVRQGALAAGKDFGDPGRAADRGHHRPQRVVLAVPELDHRAHAGLRAAPIPVILAGGASGTSGGRIKAVREHAARRDGVIGRDRKVLAAARPGRDPAILHHDLARRTVATGQPVTSRPSYGV